MRFLPSIVNWKFSTFFVFKQFIKLIVAVISHMLLKSFNFQRSEFEFVLWSTGIKLMCFLTEANLELVPY